MTSKIKKGYKYCIVPECTSTTIKTPNKIFFHVPLHTNNRKKWCKMMKRDLIGPKSTKYVCEDHFDLEKDTENLIKYKLVGGTLKLKTEVCPHKFDCQKVENRVRESESETTHQTEYLENSLKDNISSTSSSPFEECDTMYEESCIPEDPLRIS